MTFPRAFGQVLPLAVAGALLAGACGGGERPELVAFEPSATPVPTAAPEPTQTPAPEPTPTADAEVLPEVEEREPAAPVWQVVSSVDRLNLRAEPTTAADILFVLGPGDSGLVGTGEAATADGFDWVELAADDDRPKGWVASKFLEPDEAVAAATSRVCFHSEDEVTATTMALDFSTDAETFTGGVRLVTAANIQYLGVAGRRVEGTVFTVASQDIDVTAVTIDEWTSSPSGIVGGDEIAADAADCAELEDLVASIDLNVTTYPDTPAAPE